MAEGSLDSCMLSAELFDELFEAVRGVRSIIGGLRVSVALKYNIVREELAKYDGEPGGDRSTGAN